MRALPREKSGADRLLRQLLICHGTFYQICERANCDIESDRAERILRALFDDLIDAGHAHQVGHVYHITSAARAAIAPPAPYVGQLAGPAYRGTPHPMPVTTARRTAGARP